MKAWILPFAMLLSIAFAAAGRANDLPTLIKALGEESNRKGASVALVRLGGDAVPALRQSLSSAVPDVQVWAAFTLGEIGSQSAPALTDLKRLLSNDDKAVRCAAAAALGKIGDAKVVAPLTVALGDREVDVRQQAIVALGRIGSPSASTVPRLIVALSDHRLRPAARRTLIQVGRAATVPLVEQLDKHAVRFDAAAILRQINPTEATRLGLATPAAADLMSLRLVLNDATRTPDERVSAAQSLAALGNDGYRSLIAAFETETAARTAAEAFSAGDSDAVPLLVDSLSHQSADVRVHSANALGAIGKNSSAAVPSLVKSLQDENRNVRYSAVRALHELGPQASPAVASLTEVILNSRESEATRQWAIKTLVVTLPATHDDVVKSLIEASKEKTNYGVRQLAIQTLRAVDAKAAEEAGI